MESKTETLVFVAVVVAIALFIGSIVIIGSGSEGRNAAEQAQLDTLYDVMVGDSASIQMQIRDLGDRLHELCHVVSDAKGLDPHYCDE